MKKKNQWLLTYSDMVTLLLVFFILFVTISQADVFKSKILITSFAGNLGLLSSGNSLQESENEFLTLGNTIQSLPSEQKGKRLDSSVNQSTFEFNVKNDARKVRVIENREGVIISLFSDIFFEANSARLNYDAISEILENIRVLIDEKGVGGEILISGHTDNIPYSGNEYKDNWDLSMNRALMVLEALRQIPFLYPLDMEKVSIHAYGDTKPLESNDTPIGRSYNRRVDILLKR